MEIQGGYTDLLRQKRGHNRKPPPGRLCRLSEPLLTVNAFPCEQGREMALASALGKLSMRSLCLTLKRRAGAGAEA
jgi:hypothetical protein